MNKEDLAMEEKVTEATSQADHEIKSKGKAFATLWPILVVVIVSIAIFIKTSLILCFSRR